MNNFIIAALLVGSIVCTCGLPVTKTKKTDEDKPSTPATPDVETALEYERYLKEVVEALESDPDFRKKLDKAPEADIRSGKIAQELDYVNHHVRTKLDEIKRRELERLRSLASKDFELSNDIDRNHLKVPQHVDHDNEHTFEREDLRKLIKKTSEDLAEADRKRRAEFKEYEMQKEFEKDMVKKEMSEEQRKKFEAEQKELEEKHKKHEKVHHPGNKAQLEEVWEEQDHMDKADFDPHAFFMIHDVDGNGYWDEAEVKALFIKELDKVYQSGMPEDDMRERAEEMERMREHVFQETDTNHDGLISFQEFLEQTKRDEFNRDPEWKTVEEQPQYTHEEYLEFERRRKEEVDRMIAQGMLPPHPNMPQGYYVDPNLAHQQQPQMHYQNPQQQHMQQQQQYQQQQQQYQHHQQQQYQQQQYPQQQYQQQQYNPQQQPQYNPQQQQQQNPQQQPQYNPQQQQQQYTTQQVHLNNNQVYQHVQAEPQQQQPVVNNLPQQQQPVSGKIAQELDYVNHHVRTKLDEIKRRELERLRSLASKDFELSNDIDRNHLKVPQHVDHDNEHTFEREDLRKLIKKTSEDLAEADRKRRAEFKEYEMQKEFEKDMVKKEMSEEQRKKFEAEQKELEEKHKKHEKVHHPGNKAQLEEVWEEQDHMDKADFDPHAFFMIHDVDGNGYWDEAEVKALFIKELDKVYQSGMPEDDMRERAEEMERMREHVFQETDTNHDGLISFQEFLEQTKRDEFNRDPEWKTVEEQPQYTHEEYLEFERRRKEEVDRMIAQGMLPPHPNMPQGYYVDPNLAHQQQPQMHYQNPQQQHMQQQQQYQQQQQQYQHHQQQQYQQQQYPQQQYQQQQYNPQQQPQYNPQQQQQQNPQQQPQYNPQQQQQQYTTQQVHLNNNQVYQHVQAEPQQQQPVVNNLPQQQQPVVNNLPPQQQPVASSNPPQQPIANNLLPHQQAQPVANNNIPTQQQYQQPQPVHQQQQHNNAQPPKH